MSILCAFSASAVAQTEVKGTVVDKYGTPISGAKVQVVGTTTQTETDFNGVFSMSSLQRVKKISVSAPGRTTSIRRYKGANRTYQLRNSSFWYQPNYGWRPFALFEVAIPSIKDFNCLPVGVMVGTYFKKFGLYGKFCLSKSIHTVGSYGNDYYNHSLNLNNKPLQTGDVKGSFNQVGAGFIFCPSTPLALYVGGSYSDRKIATKNERGEWIKRNGEWTDEGWIPASYHGGAFDFGLIFQRKHLIINMGTSILLRDVGGSSAIGNIGAGYIF